MASKNNAASKNKTVSGNKAVSGSKTVSEKNDATPISADDEVAPRGVNVAVLRGVLSKAPRLVDLPSGDRLARLDLTIRRSDGQTETVPIQVVEPTATVLGLEGGSEVVVTGVVRRRYYRAGGTTASQTEVVADRIVVASHAARVANAVERALGPTAALL